MRVVFLLLAALVLVPGAQAQSIGERVGASDRCTRDCDVRQANPYLPMKGDDPVRLVLYAHIEDRLNRSPMNAQRPDAATEPDRRLDFMPCVHTTRQVPVGVDQRNCEFQFFSSPGLVEFVETGWRVHQEPGLAYPLALLGKTIDLHVALSTQAIAPQVGVWARIETGRFAQQGIVIAETQGPIAKTMVNGPGDSHDAFEFVIPLAVRHHEIPAEGTTNGFTVTVRVFQLDAPATTVTQPWQLRVGYKFPPRIVFSTEDPLRTTSLELSRFGDSTYVRWRFESALGTYNVNDEALRLRITGPTDLPPDAFEHVILRRSISFHGQFEPLSSTWRLNNTRFPLADGVYHVTVSIPTLDGAYLLVERTSFEVRDGRPVVEGEVVFTGVATPGPGPLLLFAALVALAAWRRKGKGFQPPGSE